MSAETTPTGDGLAALGSYATVVVDPPWPLAPFGPQKREDFAPDYEMMTLPDIAALPVQAVLADDARCFLWTINRYLPQSFGILEGWGLRYTFTMTWVKNGGVKSPVTPMFNSEFIIVGSRGHPAYLDTRAFFTAHYWNRGGHSEKPEGFYDLLRRVTPGPRLDVFGRRRIAGFDSWGAEAPSGPALPDRYQQPLL